MEQSSFTMGRPQAECVAVVVVAESTSSLEINWALCDPTGILVLLMVLWSSVGHQVAARCGLALEGIDVPPTNSLNFG